MFIMFLNKTFCLGIKPGSEWPGELPIKTRWAVQVMKGRTD